MAFPKQTNYNDNVLPKDRQNNPIQVGNGFQTNDNTAVTPKASPLAYTGTIQTIVVPAGAVQMVCFPSTDLRISELVNQSQYDIIPAGTKETIPCAGMANIYIAQDTANGNLRFKFIFV